MFNCRIVSFYLDYYVSYLNVSYFSYFFFLLLSRIYFLFRITLIIFVFCSDVIIDFVSHIIYFSYFNLHFIIAIIFIIVQFGAILRPIFLLFLRPQQQAMKATSTATHNLSSSTTGPSSSSPFCMLFFLFHARAQYHLC